MNKNIIIVISALIIIGGLFLINKVVNNNLNNQIMHTENNNQVENNEIVNVTFDTSMGEIKLEMYPKKAPKTVENFVKLAEDEFYDGTKFHRIINDFMIQGGDPLSKDETNRQYWGTGGPGYTFEDEQNNLTLEKGVIAMANAGPDTNGSQFFIITAQATPWLQGKHTGFGKVVSGMEIIEKIENVEVGPTDQPLQDIELKSVNISK